MRSAAAAARSSVADLTEASRAATSWARASRWAFILGDARFGRVVFVVRGGRGRVGRGRIGRARGRVEVDGIDDGRGVLFVAGVREGSFGVERGFQLAELGLLLRAVARGHAVFGAHARELLGEGHGGLVRKWAGGSSARSLAPTAAFAARCDAEAAFDLKRFAARSAATLAPDAFAPDAFAPLDDEGASAAPVSSLGVDEAKGSSLDISGGRRRSQ